MDYEPELIRVLLDWEEARVDPGFAGGWILTVRGQAPNPMERVALEPMPIGIVPEEYRGVELVGYRAEVAPDVMTPFDLSEEVHQYSGTKGIMLVGASMREQFDVAGGDPASGASA